MNGQTLTTEEQARAREWLDRVASPAACPHCGQSGWIVQERVYISRFYPVALEPAEELQLLGQAKMPLIIVVCIQCGFVKLFAAGVIGLIGDEGSVE